MVLAAGAARAAVLADGVLLLASVGCSGAAALTGGWALLVVAGAAVLSAVGVGSILATTLLSAGCSTAPSFVVGVGTLGLAALLLPGCSTAAGTSEAAGDDVLGAVVVTVVSSGCEAMFSQGAMLITEGSARTLLWTPVNSNAQHHRSQYENYKLQQLLSTRPGVPKCCY
jgi:hypothetical protein